MVTHEARAELKVELPAPSDDVHSVGVRSPERALLSGGNPPDPRQKTPFIKPFLNGTNSPIDDLIQDPHRVYG
jgi:hypothetical protein